VAKIRGKGNRSQLNRIGEFEQTLGILGRTATDGKQAEVEEMS